MRLQTIFLRSRLIWSAALLGAVALATPAAAAAAPRPTILPPSVKPAPSAPASPQGYDISYPQCGGAYPAHPAFGIVGVNDGKAYTANPCAASEYAWAQRATSTTQPHVAFYLNTGNPGPLCSPSGTASCPYGGSANWPARGTTSPLACDGSWSTSCSYDYGWNAAQNSLADASALSGTAALVVPWWLDVETANSWATDATALNPTLAHSLDAADLKGAVDALHAAGITQVGVYSTSSMWGQITGATSASSSINTPFASLPNWVPGARNAGQASQYCAPSYSFTGGPVRLTQYPSSSFDTDYACS